MNPLILKGSLALFSKKSAYLMKISSLIIGLQLQVNAPFQVIKLKKCARSLKVSFCQHKSLYTNISLLQKFCINLRGEILCNIFRMIQNEVSIFIIKILTYIFLSYLSFNDSNYDYIDIDMDITKSDWQKYGLPTILLSIMIISLFSYIFLKDDWVIQKDEPHWKLSRNF